MGRLSVSLSGLELDNPVIPASGTFGYGHEFAGLYDLEVLGSIALKGATWEPRFGNPAPRIAETPGGMLNAVGLQNPGIEAVIALELPRLAEVYSKSVIVNVGGSSAEELARCCAVCDASAQVGIIELNISCPNIHAGGQCFSASPRSAAEAVAAARAATKKPLYAKLSPNVTDIAEIALACEAAGADGLTVINTLLGMRIDLSARRPILGNVTGGLSGGAVLPVALRCVYQVYEAVYIPVIGAGGVSSAQEVIEMLLAGASAVEIGAANLTNPWVCPEIIAALPGVMDKYGIKNLKEITGGAH